MTDVKNIFAFKKVNTEKLEKFGFIKHEKNYEIKKPVLGNQFVIVVKITQQGRVDYAVIDTSTNEEYILVKTSNTQGSFIGTIRVECKKFLKEISEHCFDRDVFQYEQTQRVVQHMKDEYNAEAEFLWEKYPNYAVFRHQSNNKWFGIMMTIEGKKISSSLEGEIEIIDLKESAEKVAALVDGENYYRGYHMNKKYWYTIVLDDSVNDSELFHRIESSHSLTM